MSEVNTTIDTSLGALENFFTDLNIDLEDFVDMDKEDIVAYFEDLFLQKAEDEGTDLSAIDLKKDLTDPLDDILDELHKEIRTSISELNAILGKQGNTIAYETSLQILIESLQELDGLTKSKDGLISNLKQAHTDAKEKYISVNNGDTHTLNLANAEDGEIYHVEGEEKSLTADSIHNDETNANWLDLDNDGGYREYEWDANGDGIPDDPEYLMEEIGDLDNDDFFTEKDIAIFRGEADTTLVLSGDNIESAYIRAYDPDTDTAEIVLMLEDGSTVIVKASNFDKLVIPVDVTNAESVHTDLLAKIFEKTTSQFSLHRFTYGSEPDSDEVTFAFAYLDQTEDNTLTVEPDSDDFAIGRSYIVTCESGTTDTITIDLEQYGDDAEISFSANDDGDLIITITTSDGTIDITFVGLESSVYTGRTDYINIKGGEIDWSTFEALNDIAIPYEYANNTGSISALYAMISHDDKTLEEEGEDEGYPIDSLLSGYLDTLDSAEP